MKTALKTLLLNLNEVEFKELRLALQIADNATKLINEFNLPLDTFALKVGIPLEEVKAYLTGAYPYTVRDIAAYEAYYCELHMERAMEEIAKKAEILKLKDK